MRFIQTIFFALISVVAFAQYSDKESIGRYCATEYPTVPMEYGTKYYSILVNGSPAAKGSPFYNKIGFSSHAFYYTSNPDKANIIVEFNNVVEDEPIELIGNDPATIVKTKNDGIHINGKGAKITLGGGEKKEVIKVNGRYKAKCEKTLSYDLYLIVDGDIKHQERYEESRKFESAWYFNPNQAEDSLKVKLRTMNFNYPLERQNRKLSNMVGGGTLSLAGLKYNAYSARSSKKNKYDYTEINDAVNKFVKASEILCKNDFEIEQFKAACDGVVEVWENALKEQDLTNTKARINDEVSCGLNYNIGLYYMFLKDFDTSFTYFKKVTDIDPKFGRVKYIIEELPKWKKLRDTYEAMMEAESK